MTYTPHKELRYIFPIALPLIILSSDGILFFVDRIKKPVGIFLLLVTAGYFLFLIYPRIDYSFSLADYSEPNEVKASRYLADELGYQGIIYANHNWPVLAYYSGLETRVLVPQDNAFYNEFPSNMPEKGILIIDVSVDKHPTPQWLSRNSGFVFIKRFESVFIYEYNL